MLSQILMLSPGQLAVALLDIAIVAFVIYRLYALIRGTRAVQLLKGVVILLVITVVSQRLNLMSVNWLLEKSLVMLLVALPVVFQPELRRGLEQLGRGGFFRSRHRPAPDRIIDEVVRAAADLSNRGRGLLVVIERTTGLGDIIETGTRLDAVVSANLITGLFLVDGPLHDGALVISGDRMAAAGCFLPLTDAVGPGSGLGGRHRAAIGVTEQSDAVAVIVSEETGEFSVAVGGELTRGLTRHQLRDLVVGLYGQA